MKYLITFLLLITSNILISQDRKTYDLVKDFGAKADNKTDNYAAFTKAAETISKNGGGILNIPRGAYYIAAYKISGGPNKNNITDVVFKNCAGLTINGNNSTIRVNGKFTRKLDYSIQNGRYNYSYTNSVIPFMFTNCKNVILKDIILYGEVDKMKRDKGVAEGSNYGVMIFDANKTDASGNILLKNITTHHFATDGIMVCTNGRSVDIVDCKSYLNARQGLSIVKGYDIKCINSNFDSTGNNRGLYGAHSPAAGIDVESEYGPATLENVIISNCNIRGNRGFQIVSNLRAANITVDSCFISDSNGGYGGGLNGVGLYSINSTLTNSIILGTIQVDLGSQKYKGDKLQQIVNNIIYSGQNAILSARMPAKISDNIIVMLPAPINTYLPYIQNPNCIFSNNLVVIHPDRVEKAPNIYISLVQNSKKVSNNFWLLNNNSFNTEKKGTHFYNIAFTRSQSITNQFFPINNFTKKINFAGKKMLTENQNNLILSNELFSAFKQNKFDKKYLIQADKVRKIMAEIIASSK